MLTSALPRLGETLGLGTAHQLATSGTGQHDRVAAAVVAVTQHSSATGD